MTRETKIGLLVGLAFIIVIGILLSDHLTSATEPQQAQLAQVAGNVRTGVTVPGESSANPPITVAQPPQAAPVTPQQTVPLKQELTPPKPPVEIVSIGGLQQSPAPQSPAPVTVAPPAPPAVQQPQPPGQIAPSAPIPAPGGSLATVAKTMGEEVVTIDGRKIDAAAAMPTKVALVNPQHQQQLPPGAKLYKVEGGDSLSKIAATVMGGDSRGNRNAIIAANPSLQQNPNLLVAGKTYIIPAAPAPAAPSATPAQLTAPTQAPMPTPMPTPLAVTPPPAQPMPPPAPEVKEVPVAPAVPEHFYVVKVGDTLTKIAVEQLGSAGGVPALVDLNQDVLKGRDIIRPNMKLRLPAKPMASAE